MPNNALNLFSATQAITTPNATRFELMEDASGFLDQAIELCRTAAMIYSENEEPEFASSLYGLLYMMENAQGLLGTGINLMGGGISRLAKHVCTGPAGERYSFSEDTSAGILLNSAGCLLSGAIPLLTIVNQERDDNRTTQAVEHFAELAYFSLNQSKSPGRKLTDEVA